jgi:hypothetical protein
MYKCDLQAQPEQSISGGYSSTANSIYYHQLGLISYRDLGPKKSMA